MKLCCIINPEGICSICNDQVCEDCMPRDWHKRPIIGDGETFRWCPKSPELPIHWGEDNLTLVIGKVGDL
jgi:hypothetical protein